MFLFFIFYKLFIQDYRNNSKQFRNKGSLSPLLNEDTIVANSAKGYAIPVNGVRFKGLFCYVGRWNSYIQHHKKTVV